PVSFLRLANPPPGRRILPEKIADELRVMLESVVTDAGTGTLARVVNYRVSGKTGTARKADDGGYSDTRYTSVFCGMIPAEHPRLVAVVVINDPSEGDYYGGLVSAPVFSSVMTGAMRILDVPPDDVALQKTAAVVHVSCPVNNLMNPIAGCGGGQGAATSHGHRYGEESQHGPARQDAARPQAYLQGRSGPGGARS
ncbi:MAG TPA: penicillin-binding transpeptidase domain-containing protein, partial [Gammaproteobacteria bacterium]|nr:penicillin-binding transpeptidase domain-containing protein [Gammaproteobacteria bacterium]